MPVRWEIIPNFCHCQPYSDKRHFVCIFGAAITRYLRGPRAKRIQHVAHNSEAAGEESTYAESVF